MYAERSAARLRYTGDPAYIGSGDVGASSSDGVDVETDSTGVLGDHGASLECIVDTFDRVLLHGDQEAGRHLGVGCTSCEEGRGSMGKVSLRHLSQRM